MTASTRNAPQVLVELGACLGAAAAGQGGALWRLAEAGRQMDANVVRLPPGAAVAEHVEPDLDVLLLVVDGDGVLGGGPQPLLLEPHALVWLPRAASRTLAAGPRGLACLTVHRRRPGLSVQGLSTARTPLPDPAAVEGGEAPCMLDRVCAACGRVSADSASARFCAYCGEPLPGREG